MQRRFLMAAMASGSALALAGCGFALRKAPDFAFTTLLSPLAETSPLGVQLKRSLEANGKVRVVSDVKQLDANGVILEVLGDQREKVVVGLTASGQVREFQLRMRFKFRLRTPQGRELIPDTEIAQQRDISFNESAVLAKEAEENLLYRDMQSDIVQQLMRRLAAVDTAAPPRTTPP
jgi:LPS-assembly lipoprotein